ncbi:MAG: hypothetical protein ACRD3N_12055 [Terracidiphilus sp.]
MTWDHGRRAFPGGSELPRPKHLIPVSIEMAGVIALYRLVDRADL